MKPPNNNHRFEVYGVALEFVEAVRRPVEVARAWGYITDGDGAAALTYLDRILAMLWRLNH